MLGAGGQPARHVWWRGHLATGRVVLGAGCVTRSIRRQRAVCTRPTGQFELGGNKRFAILTILGSILLTAGLWAYVLGARP